MIDVISTVRDIIHRAPQPFSVPAFGEFPEFEAARELAEIVQADPSDFYTQLDALINDGSLIDEATSTAQHLVEMAINDIADIATEFISHVMSNSTEFLHPLLGLGAVAESGVFGMECLARADARAAQLQVELDPVAENLESLDPPVEASVPPPPPPEEPAAPTNSVGQAAVAAAKSQLGTPYVWGGTQPGGFDCSGLTSWAYAQAGFEIPRLAEQQAVGQQVSFDELQAGDLIVWDGHVAMYTEDGMMIEAGDPVQINPVRTENIGMPFKGFWRPTA
ncbi:C40 family peptidase [Corynebacterium breve]|uniref:C40 family peptidase n=1 Tax=Corynebacterium breve TaxID=3049799 RepID=A0ABY8VIZ5_9CORY|nr:C40 family peptidase [Corynebacterium breve]WIM68208.1 C40 family peptidase [Corynebacterium breve]